MRRRIVLCALLALAAPAGPASAATVEVRVVEAQGMFGSGEHPEWRVLFAAAPGERNDVRLRALDHYTVRVHDAGAPVAAGERCRRVDASTAHCAVPSDQPGVDRLSPFLSTAAVQAGDMDDRVRVEAEGGPRLVGDGGPGDDVLIGSDLGSDELDGGGGRDRLFGRGNYDELTDGDTPGAVDADVLDGGGGDFVSYARRTRDLRIDLADGRPDGEAGEGDRLVGIDHVDGGAGDDDIGGDADVSWLRGGAGDDHLDGEGGEDNLEGGPGDDRLHGHDGDDDVTGGTGRDQLRGDAGSDVFSAPTIADDVRCGAGEDGVANPRGIIVRPDCERLGFSFDEDGAIVDEQGVAGLSLDPHPVLSSTGRSLRFSLGCAQLHSSDGTCSASRGALRLSTPAGTTLGIATFANPLADESELRVTVPLSPAGRRLAARGTLLRVSLRGDRVPTARWLVRPFT